MRSMSSRTIAAAFAIAVSGCVRTPVNPGPDAPPLQPMEFFTGRTHGDGELAKLLGSPVRVSVDSIGRRQGDTLILDQTIREGGSAPSVRRWTMMPAGPNRYSGTLTGAAGPVTVAVSGSRADIRYRTKAGLDIAQTLVLQRDGKTISNRLRAHRFGLRVATLNETIRKQD